MIKPQQRLPKSQKNKEWREKCVEYYNQQTTAMFESRSKFAKLYRLANGDLDEEDYRYVTNPYNTVKEELQRFPAKIRNYDIITPIVNLLIGEKARRPFNFQVFCHNRDSYVQKREEEFELLTSVMQQMFINELNQMGMETGVESQETPLPEKIVQEFASNWVDKRAEIGQNSLDFIHDDQRVTDKWQELFYDLIVTDYCFSYKDSLFDSVLYEPVSAFDIAYVGSPGLKYIEDGEAATKRVYMSISEVIDMFHEDITDEEIADLESDISSSSSMTPLSSDGFQKRGYENTNKLILVVHVVWKSLKKIGKVTRVLPTGEIEEFEVDETYRVADGEEIDWRWVNQVWEGYKIHDKYYKSIQPLPIQRGTFDNPSKCKLPYNGICLTNKHSDSKSIVERLMPYQVLYNIVHYRMEMTMAKNKDKITVMPIGVMPKKEGWDMQKMLYYADATGYMFYDETDKDMANAIQYIKVLDSQLNDYIRFVYEILAQIKQDAEDFLGVTRQRKGQIMASDGMSNTERSIFQSSVMTEYLFSSMEEFQRRELQGLLDVSKHAWRNGKRAQYVSSDMRLSFLNITPDYAESEFGVFVRHSAKEAERLEQLKQLSQAFAQNQVGPSMIAEILASDNFQVLRGKLEEMERKQQEMMQQQQQAQESLVQQQAQAQQELQDKQTQVDFEKQQRDLDYKYQELALKYGKDTEEFERAKLEEERRANQADEQIKREQLKTTERIADKNNATQRQISKDRPKPTKPKN